MAVDVLDPHGEQTSPLQYPLRVFSAYSAPLRETCPGPFPVFLTQRRKGATSARRSKGQAPTHLPFSPSSRPSRLRVRTSSSILLNHATERRRPVAVRNPHSEQTSPLQYPLRVLSAYSAPLRETCPRPFFFSSRNGAKAQRLPKVQGTGTPSRSLEPRNSRNSRKGWDMISLSSPFSVFFASFAASRESLSLLPPTITPRSGDVRSPSGILTASKPRRSNIPCVSSPRT